jgi:hypothetical protein
VAVELFANQPSTYVTSGGTDAPSSGTVETWTVASSSAFPAANSSASPPTQFHVCDPTIGYQTEIITVTNVSGTTWTVTRGAESTTPVAHLQEFTVTQIVTAGFLETVVSSSAVPFNARGTAEYSTTYNPWDVILHYGEWLLVTRSFTTGSGTDGIGEPFISGANYVKLTSQGYFWASDYGVSQANTDNWSALQSLLILVRSLSGTGYGFRVILPYGYISISKTIILPTQTMLEGQGLYSTALRINVGSNCDVLQTEEYDSSAQAALLTQLQPSLTAGNLVNAFRWGVRNLTLHGNAANQSPGSYYMGLNVQTNPRTTTAPTDPDFDPAGIVENVQFRDCTGDGYYHYGRSAARLIGTIAWFNNGNGYSPSFDTQIIGCQAGFNGIAGFYQAHGAQASANKSYNNGANIQWATGSNYSVLTRVMYGGTPYDAINALTDDTTPPPSDPTNWAPVSATSPQAWGVGVYLDGSTAAECTFNCDCQENVSWNWYLHDCTNAGNHLTGTSLDPNYSYQNDAIVPSNPNYYAHVCLDGSNGHYISIACGDSSGFTSTQYRLRLVNGSTRNEVHLTGDTNATFLSPDSTAVLGSGNIVTYNGVGETTTLALENDVSVSAPANGQGLVYNTSISKWQNQTLPTGNYLAVFGDGTDGSATLDGSTTYNNWSSLAGSTYTMTRDVYCTSLTIDNGVTLNTSFWRIFCQGTVTNNGTITGTGNAGGANGAAGAKVTNTSLGSAAGAAGNTGAGGSGTQGCIGGNAGAGGTGASGAAGAAGGVITTVPTAYMHEPFYALSGIFAFNTLVNPLSGGGGGGGGGGDGTNKGGGGGGGAPCIVIFAHAMTNAGAITTVGGAGGTPATGNCGGGGGGGGGAIFIYTLTAWTNTGTTSISGGAGGSGVGTGAAGTSGSAGYPTTALNYVLS